MRNQKKPLILIVDDEEAILKTLKDALSDESYRVETLAHGGKALDLIGKLIPDLVLLDIFMPHCNGLQLLSQIKKEYPNQKVIIISGFGNIPIAIEAVKNGALDFIEKPLNLDEILNKISFLQKKDPIHREGPEYKTDRQLLKECGIIGESNLFLELIEQAERLAPHTFHLLIYGEYGTGKSTLAHYIHKKSLISHQPFKPINGETLEEKSLLATFAGEEQKTIYVKNVDKLTPEHQKTLLILLESNKSARVIASSNQSLFLLMREKKFNESLFYHLNKAPLEVPPLRKRPYDIPLLINHYLQKYNENFGTKIAFSTQSIRLLRNYKWPGNIIELQQAIEKIVIHNVQNHEIITPQELTEFLGEKTVQFIEDQTICHFSSLEEATIEFKKNFLLYLLQKNHYNINQVSHRLNLSPAQLKNKLLELEIDIQEYV